MKVIVPFCLFALLVLWKATFSLACQVQKANYHIPAGSTQVSEVVRRFRPHFSYIDACNSYPAVTEDGKMSAGLPGSRDLDKCRDQAFEQSYVREAFFHESRGSEKAYMAIMYALFAPKDNGHRYDWEDVIVFIDDQYQPIKAAASFHGGYLISRPKGEPAQWNEDRVRAKYTSCICNCAFQFSVHDGMDPPMKSWYMMKQEERDAITNGCWENGIPKLTDENFRKTLDRAWAETEPSFWASTFCKIRCTYIKNPHLKNRKLSEADNRHRI